MVRQQESRTKRMLKDLSYRSLRGIIGFFARNYFFDLNIKGKENLDEKGGILALNHCIKPAGLIIGSIVPDKVHYLIQYEGIYDGGYGAFLEFINQIPVGADRLGLRKVFQSSKYYSEEFPDDYLGIFIDGGSFRDSLDVRERKSYRGVARIAKRLNRPIIPVATYADAKTIMKSNSLGRNFLRNIFWHVSNPKIPYGISFGKPISPVEFDESDLVLKIKDEQIKLYEDLARDFSR